MKKVTAILATALIASTGFAAQMQEQNQVQGDLSEKNSASVSANKGNDSEIKDLIQQIKEAPPSEKYIYINKLKEKLHQVSKEKRREVMEQLRQQYEKGHTNAEKRKEMLEEHTKHMNKHMDEKSEHVREHAEHVNENINEKNEHVREHVEEHQNNYYDRSHNEDRERGEHSRR